MPSRPSGGRGAHRPHHHNEGRRFHRPKDAKVSKACRFHFSPGGSCCRGDKCHFSHDPRDAPDRLSHDANCTNNSSAVAVSVGEDGTSPTTVVDSTTQNTTTGTGGKGNNQIKPKSSSRRNSSSNSHLPKSRRPCKFGLECRKLHNGQGKCPYEHPQDYNTPAMSRAHANNDEEYDDEESEEDAEEEEEIQSGNNVSMTSPPLPPPPPSSWVATSTGKDAASTGEFEYRRYASPTPETNPYSARTDLESLLLQGMMGMGMEQQEEQREPKSSKEQLLLASLGLTTDDLHMAVHGTTDMTTAATGAGAADATPTVEYVEEEDEEEEEEVVATTTAAYTATPDKSNANSRGPPRPLLSPITLAEAEHNLSKLTTLSQSWQVDGSSTSNQQAQMGEFNAALQMCRSVQMTVVETLQTAMMGGDNNGSGGDGEEEELTQLLELNESLLTTIGNAEQSLVDARNGAAARAAEANNSSNDAVDPAVAMGLPKGFLTQLTPEEYEALEKRDAEEAYLQKYGRTKEQDFGPSEERLAELAEEERQAKKERRLAQKLGLEPADAGGDAAPKKAKKKRIRKKKNKGTADDTNADADATDSKPKAATHTPEELAKIKAEELEATRRAEAAERAKQDERDRLARMREEARQQQAAARERKKVKKAQKYQRKKAEQVEAEAARTKMWAEERAKNQYKARTEILQSLCITELIRQSSTKVMGLSSSRVQEDESAMASIRDVSNKAFRELYKHDIKLRVVVAGVDTTGGGSSNGKKELNGRHGTILSYDETKGDYRVALDTKKGKQDDVQAFKPENLDVAEDSKNAKSSGKGRGKNGPGARGHNVDHSYGIFLPGLLSYGGVSLDLDFLVSRSDVAWVENSSHPDFALKEFSAKRAQEERMQKLLEEEERAREAEARKRRAELRAREEEERRRRQAEKEREREEMLQFLRKQKERMAAGDSDEGHHHRRQYYESDDEGYDDDDDDGYGEFCDCAQCRMRARMQHDFMFMSMFGGMRGGMPHPIFMAMFGGRGGMGGMPFAPGMGGFYEEDDDDDEYYEEEDDEDDFFRRFFFGGGFDDAYEEREARRRQEENEEQAEILGVPVDADARTIKTKYRRLAVQYHPDKWRQDSEHGMTKDDAEEKFKEMQSAYDHLMANFDEDE